MSSVTKGALITGEDLKHLGKLLGRKVNEILWLFGCSYARWTEVSKSKPEDIRITYSLLGRLILNHPEMHPIPTPPSPEEVFAAIKEVDPSFRKRSFAVLLGMQPGSSIRLLDPSKPARVSSIVANLMLIIKTELEKAETPQEKRRILDIFKSMAEEEATARGISLQELWEGGGWLTGNDSDDDSD